MFLYTFMGITFSSAPVSILKFVFVSFIYSSVNDLFCCTVFTFFQYGVHVVALIHMMASVMCVHVTRIFVFASAHFCEITTLAAFSAGFVICWAFTFVMCCWVICAVVYPVRFSVFLLWCVSHLIFLISLCLNFPLFLPRSWTLSIFSVSGVLAINSVCLLVSSTLCPACIDFSRVKSVSRSILSQCVVSWSTN